MTIRISRPFTVGEVPPPIVYEFQDGNGDPINLAGFEVAFHYRVGGLVPVTRVAVLDTDGTNGQVRYNWVVEDLVAGEAQGEFWVGNGTNRYASDVISWRTRPAVTTAPEI